MKPVFLFIFIFFCLHNLYCQHSDYSFGEVTREELLIQDCAFEPGAPAMILAERCELISDVQAPYHVSRINKRIKILTKEGLSYGNFELEYLVRYTEISMFNACIYNLVDGEIVAEKLKLSDIFVTSIDKNTSSYSVSLPNVKVGSVVDIFYKRKDENALSFQPWYFQSEIPCCWSEYISLINKKATYIYHFTDFLPFTVNTIQDPSQSTGSKGGNTINRFVVENAPSYHFSEPFVLRPQDQLSKIELVFNSFNENSIWGNAIKPLTWNEIHDNLLKHPYLGKVINKGKFLRDPLKEILVNCTDFEDSLRKVYEYIRNTVKPNGYRSIYASKLQKALTGKSGNTGEINLLLITALREVGFDCHPLLLPTYEEAPSSQDDPRRNGINYLVAAVFKDTSYYLLDASDRDIAFNTLPFYCLNGEGFLISNHLHEHWLPLLRNERYETKTEVTLDWLPNAPAKGNVIVKSYSLSANGYRRLIKDNGEEEYVKSRKDDYPNHNISVPAYTGLNQTDSAFVENFTYSLQSDEYNVSESYFLPVMPFSPFRENPFDAIKRDFRIDFIAPKHSKTDVTINVPEGYGIVHFPESIIVDNLNNDFSFDFSVEVSPDQRIITVHSDIRINRYIYSKDEYNILRQFFTEIVKMQNSFIELKRL